MPSATQQRKKEFKIALIRAGLTATQFASVHGVTDNHLWMVLAGRRTSARIIALVDRFIEQHAQQPAA